MSEVKPIREHAKNGEPWWLLLMRAYQKRGTEGRLHLAYLAAARTILFGGDANAKACLDEIRADSAVFVELIKCASSNDRLLWANPNARVCRPVGLPLSANAEAGCSGGDIERVCRELVEEADRRLAAGTPSLEPAGLMGYELKPFSTEDLEMIEAVRCQLARTASR